MEPETFAEVKQSESAQTGWASVICYPAAQRRVADVAIRAMALRLAVRFARALWAFGIILADYLIQRYLGKLFTKRVFDPKTGLRRRVRPAWLNARGQRLHERNAGRTLNAMLRLRGVYIKLGQVLSIMGGFLPRAFTQKLQVLQDQVPAHPFFEVEAVFLRQLGRLPNECFAHIAREPVAAASLGQVHMAYLHDGTKVAVKVLYAGIRDVIKVDMIVVRLALKVYKWFVPIDNIENSYTALTDLLQRETNYLHEATCMERMAKNFHDDADILFPSVVREFTTDDVLTMTYMEGVKITDFEALEELGLARNVIATRLVQCFYKQLFVHRYFHADPHPGNLLVQKGDNGIPHIVVLDFGSVSEAKDEIIEGLLDVTEGLFGGDSDKLISGFNRMGFVAPGADRDTLERLAKAYFGKLMKFEDRSPAAFMQADREALTREFRSPDLEVEDLRELMRSVHYPETWFYVERATVIMFWLVATIDATVDTVQVGVPYLMPLLLVRGQRSFEHQARAQTMSTERATST